MGTTFVETAESGFGPAFDWLDADPEFLGEWQRALSANPGLAPTQLGGRFVGETITDHRSSWVRRCRVGAIEVFVKTYEYPRPQDRLRGVLRTTILAPSRVAREIQALRWLRANGFAAPRPLARGELRSFGWLRRATLVTEALPGTSLDRCLPSLETDARFAVLAAVDRFVSAIHSRGYVDRNLDPRNLIVHADELGAPTIAKVDSPRFKLVHEGRTKRRLVAEDWARLNRGLAALGIDR